MSTRCHIFIKDSKQTYSVYHHCDGYPSGVGQELDDFLSNFKDIKKNNLCAKVFTKILSDLDSSYEIDSGFHGDEEYVYNININIDKIVLSCYKRENWKDDDYLNWPEVKDFTKTYERDIN